MEDGKGYEECHANKDTETSSEEEAAIPDDEMNGSDFDSSHS